MTGILTTSTIIFLFQVKIVFPRCLVSTNKIWEFHILMKLFYNFKARYVNQGSISKSNICYFLAFLFHFLPQLVNKKSNFLLCLRKILNAKNLDLKCKNLDLKCKNLFMKWTFTRDPQTPIFLAIKNALNLPLLNILQKF